MGLMQQCEFLTVANVSVKILCYGEFTPSENTKPPKKLVLIIPGVFGIVEFYAELAKTIYTKYNLPVWITSHGGHTEHPDIIKGSQYYDFKAQVQQKIEIIEKYLKGIKLIIVGHSIGAVMLLKILKNQEISDMTSLGYLIFPIIDRVPSTPAGKMLGWWGYGVKYPVTFFMLKLFNIIPRSWKMFLIKLYLFFMGRYNEENIKGYDLASVSILRKVDILGRGIYEIIDRDDDVIRANVKRLRFLYGANDGWTPREYVRDLREKCPDLRIHVVENIEHAFCCRKSKQIGDIVVYWLNEDECKN